MRHCVGIFLFIFTLSFQAASAQPSLPDHKIMVSEHTGVQRLTSILPLGLRPVFVKDLQIPDTLTVGSEGLFSVQVNVETATLPIEAVWTFGDGRRTRGLATRHAFARPGEYDVEIVLSNRAGEKTVRRRVVVIDSPEH